MRELLEELKAQRDHHRTELAQRDETIVDLRRRLDAADEERRVALRLLEDQRTKASPATGSRFFRWLLRKPT